MPSKLPPIHKVFNLATAKTPPVVLENGVQRNFAGGFSAVQLLTDALPNENRRVPGSSDAEINKQEQAVRILETNIDDQSFHMMIKLDSGCEESFKRLILTTTQELDPLALISEATRDMIGFDKLQWDNSVILFYRENN